MNSEDIIDVADLDCIYLSYDEPQKEEFWLKIKNMVPWAKRVDGVKGSDAAHKAAGEASDTERFILIDGDNMPKEDFFNIQLDFTGKDESFKRAQFRWKAINNINGLRYGNAGMSSWTKEYVANMKTHEHQKDGDVSRIAEISKGGEDNQYWAKETVSGRNLDNLTVWHNIGADVENGMWAIYGARLGTYMTMLTEWDHANVQWFDNYTVLWEEHEHRDPATEAELLGMTLQDKLGLPMCVHSPEQSKFFKRHYGADKYNRGPLVTEMEVIRQIQGW